MQMDQPDDYTSIIYPMHREKEIKYTQARTLL